MKQYAGEYYHAYNRAIAHQLLFPHPSNYTFLLRRIKQYLAEYPVKIIAYCLMPNHYHLLVRTDSENAFSPFIQRIFNGYVQAINHQEQRHGTLFESNMKYCHIDSEDYMRRLIRYIHLNPVHAGLVSRPQEWPYSNYLDWVGKREGSLVDRDFIRQVFGSGTEYELFILANEAYDDPEVLDKLTLERL